LFAVLVAIGALNAIPTHFGADLNNGLFKSLPMWKALNRGLNLRFDQLFLLGMVLYESRRRGWRALDFVLIGLCLVCEVLVDGGVTLAVVIGLFGLAWMAVQTSVLARPPRVLIYLGTTSYAMYLLHQNIGYVVIGHLYRHGAGRVSALVIALAAMVVYASAFTFGFERPVNQGIRRWWKARRAASSSAAAASR
jgi:peptidoglycan/LPS O-acetylase OafA/YrhL